VFGKNPDDVVITYDIVGPTSYHDVTSHVQRRRCDVAYAVVGLTYIWNLGNVRYRTTDLRYRYITILSRYRTSENDL
jgi:hypothetical protein